MKTTQDVLIQKSLGTYKPLVYLSNLAIAYYESAEYAHRRLFPVVQTELPSGHYYEFKKEHLAKDQVYEKPAYGKVQPAVFGLNTKSYSCKVFQTLIGLDQIMTLPYQRTGAPGSADPVRARVKMITEQIATHQERDFAENFFKVGAWDNTWTGATTADTANKKFLKFDNTDSDPVTLFDNLAIEIRRNGRRRPNKLALGIETFAALKANPSILERIKYSGTTQNPSIVNENVLAQVFGVDQVVVLDATNFDGEKMTFTCDSKGALLLYAPDTPAIDMPSAGYCFSWRLDNNNYIGISTFEGEPGTHTDMCEGIIAYDQKITGQDLAIYLSDCVG